MSDEVSDLVQELRGLQIQRTGILERERQITRRLEEVLSSQTSGATPQAGRVSPEPQRDPGVFEVGDHVSIKNRITHVPRYRRQTPSDRAAIVRRVAFNGTRVDITTYNRHDTWRSPTNLRHLTAEERGSIPCRLRQ